MTWVNFFWGMAFGACYAFTFCNRPGLAVIVMGLGCGILIPVSIVIEFLSIREESRRSFEEFRREIERTSSPGEDSGGV